MQIQKELKIRLPTKEPSKVDQPHTLVSNLVLTPTFVIIHQNWRYDAAGDLGPTKLGSRPFGWLDVVVGENSTVAYEMAMVAHERGYESMLQLHLDSISMSSSVNQSRFLLADSCRVSKYMFRLLGLLNVTHLHAL